MINSVIRHYLSGILEKGSILLVAYQPSAQGPVKYAKKQGSKLPNVLLLTVAGWLIDNDEFAANITKSFTALFSYYKWL